MIKELFINVRFRVKDYFIAMFCLAVIVFSTYLMISASIYSIKNEGVLIGIFMNLFGWLGYLITVFLFALFPFMFSKNGKDTSNRKRNKTAVQKGGLVHSAKHNKRDRIILIILLIVMFGVASTCIGIYVSRLALKSAYIETQATYINEIVDGGDGLSQKQFKYFDANGNEYTYTTPGRSNTNTYKQGDIITIYYNPDNPQIVYESGSELFLLGFGLFFLFCFLICILSYLLNGNDIRNYLFIAFACIGITMIAGIFMASDGNITNLFDLVNKMPVFQFVLIFGYFGVLMLYLAVLEMIGSLYCRLKRDNRRKR